MRLRVGLLVMLWSLLLFPVWGQQPAMISYGVADGLPSSTVYFVLQHSDGRIWLGTDKGVSKFDGYSFRNFTSLDGLTDNEVFVIEPDSEGRLWMMTANGIPCYFEDGAFKHPEGLNQFGGGLNGYLSSFLEPEPGTYFLTSYLGDIAVIRGTKVERILKGDDFPFHSIYYIWRNKKGTILLLTDSGVHELLADFSTRQVATAPANIYAAKAVELATGELVFIAGYKLFLFSERTGITEVELGFDRSLQGLAPSGSNTFWVAPKVGPPLRYRLDGSEVVLVDSIPSLDGATFLAEDHEGGMWVSTLINGLYRVSSTAAQIWKVQPGSWQCFSLDNENQLWIGSRSSALGKLSGNQWEIEPFFSSDYQQDYEIRELYFLDHDTIVVSNKPIIVRSATGDQLFRPHCSQLVIDDDALWSIGRMGIFQLPATYFDDSAISDSMEVSFNYLNRYRVYDERVYQLHRDAAGAFWIGTTAGVLQQVDNQFEPRFSETALGSARVRAIAEWNQNMAFASDGYGVWLFREDSLFQFTEREGLSNNIINCLYADADGKLWIGSASGIDCIDLQADSLQIQTLSKVAVREVNQLTGHGGKIYAATETEIVAFPQNILEEPILAPLMRVDGIWVNDSAVSTQHLESFEAGTKNLRFAYTALSYQQHEMQYEYRLLGHSDEWKRTDQRAVEFAALPPGDYRFQVRALYANGRLTESETLAFSIAAHIWQQLWFWMVIVFVVVAIVYIAFRAGLLVFDAELFRDVLRRLIDRLKSKDVSMLVKDVKDGSLTPISARDLLYIESSRNYLSLVMRKRTVLIRASMVEFAARLEEEGFDSCIRIHKSYIVNSKHVDSFHSTFVNVGDQRLPVGPKYAESIDQLSENIKN